MVKMRRYARGVVLMLPVKCVLSVDKPRLLIKFLAGMMAKPEWRMLLAQNMLS